MDQFLKNQIAIMQALSELLPSANHVQLELSVCIAGSLGKVGELGTLMRFERGLISASEAQAALGLPSQAG